jgi:UDP-N-acetylmuramyl-tripeptide synthetase
LKLSELASVLPAHKLSGNDGVEITGITHDSRKVVPGDLFLAMPGYKTDGSLHAAQACRQGAVAVMCERSAPPEILALGVAWISVANAAEAMGLLADRFFNHPSAAMEIIGVTGTNGKTTTTYFLESIFNACKIKIGVAGTINYRMGLEFSKAAPNTTPVSLELLRLLARFRDGGAKAVAMEVSSHALALKRVEQIDFDAAIFTNLSRDHLDFHKTPEEYFKAKARLFELLMKPTAKKRKTAALNAEDARSQALEALVTGARVLRYGLGPKANWKGEIRSIAPSGTKFDILNEKKRFPAEIFLVGEHNVYNALAASAAAYGMGLPIEGITQGLKDLKVVPGRLEPVEAGQNFHVFVDYAHTDSALETVLSYLKRLPHQRLLTVFGCGGDRDRTKRGPMGLAACSSSDLAIITSDNPRSEDPLAIIADIEEGLKAKGLKNYKVVPQREEAIRLAVQEAQDGDILLIAGKGHENYQILKDKTIHFDDREAALAALKARSQRS